MDDQNRSDAVSRNMDRSAPDDIDEGPHVGFVTVADFEERAHLEMHRRAHPHDRAHVDLLQEEYTPEEVARLIGTSMEVVLHAIRAGELQAERKGRAVICITHADVVEWLRQRGGV